MDSHATRDILMGAHRADPRVPQVYWELQVLPFEVSNPVSRLLLDLNKANCAKIMVFGHKIEFVVLPISGMAPIGYVVLGVAKEEFLKLKEEFPDRPRSGEDPGVNGAIKDGVTEEERKQISEHLQIRQWDGFNLEFRTPGTRYLEEEKEAPAFESN